MHWASKAFSLLYEALTRECAQNTVYFHGFRHYQLYFTCIYSSFPVVVSVSVDVRKTEQLS